MGRMFTFEIGRNTHGGGIKGWSGINFNWADGGNNRAGFYGCRTGVDPKGQKSSFVTTISRLANFKNVTVAGQTSYSFPSYYTNYRSNGNREEGDFITSKKDGKIAFSRTYMVGGVRRRDDWNGNEQNVAKPMRYSRNGGGSIGGYQRGDKK